MTLQEIYCRHCGRRIFFDRRIKGINGKCCPLEYNPQKHDLQKHQCSEYFILKGERVAKSG